jgi:hypothetical protein
LKEKPWKAKTTAVLEQIHDLLFLNSDFEEAAEEAKAFSEKINRMAGAARVELAAQRLDLLNHYRWHFESGLPADQEYFEKFTALAEVMSLEDLAAAGRRGDAPEINRLLPDVYEALEAATQANGAGANVEDVLSRLKTVLEKGDAQGAAVVMGELRGMDVLSADERELYFFLHDALYMGETEKAVGGLTVWMKFYHAAT